MIKELIIAVSAVIFLLLSLTIGILWAEWLHGLVNEDLYFMGCLAAIVAYIILVMAVIGIMLEHR